MIQLQTSKILENNGKMQGKEWKKVADKNKVKKRMEKKLKQCYMGPCKKKIPTCPHSFLSFFSSYYSPSFFNLFFFYFINFPWPSLLVQISPIPNVPKL